MGKKKSNKNNSRKSGSGSRNFKKLKTPLIATVCVLGLLLGAHFLSGPPATPVAPAKGQLVETRPVLTAAMFSGKAALAYKYAAEIPKVIDSQFCYCYCKKNHGHKTLLTCFTNTHGSKCDVCMDEVIYAYELYKEGKTLDEIVVAVDKKFYRPFKRHL